MESLVTYNIFQKLSYVTLPIFKLHVSDLPTYCFLALMGLNKDEAIYKFIVGISIYGAAWSYNNVKQLHIGMYITLTPSTLSITPFASSLSYIQLHITPTNSLSIFHVSAYCSILLSYIPLFLFLCMVCIAGFNCGQKS